MHKVLPLGSCLSPKPILQKSRIRETKNLSTDADSRTDTILEKLHDLSLKKIFKKI